jgi:hypothetical protein
MRLASRTVLLLLAASATVSSAAERAVSSDQLSALISSVRAATDPSTQDLVARDLRRLVAGAYLGNIDDKTIEDLASLLDLPNDAARHSVAIALGLFEKRALFTLPKLLDLHQKAYCARLRGEAEPGSTDAIRFAIQNITGGPLPGTVCLLKIEDQKSA